MTDPDEKPITYYGLEPKDGYTDPLERAFLLDTIRAGAEIEAAEHGRELIGDLTRTEAAELQPRHAEDGTELVTVKYQIQTKPIITP